MSIKGRLILLGHALYDALDVELSVESSSPQTVVYVGEFSIPGSFAFDPDDAYELRLGDGRSFGISVQELRLMINGGVDRGSMTTVTFRSQE